MGRISKGGGTPRFVDGNIDGEKRRVVGALERPQIPGCVDDGDGSRDADCTGGGYRCVDEGDCGFTVDRGSGNGLGNGISFAAALSSGVTWTGKDQNPSRTVLPFAAPLSISACTVFRLAALIGDSRSVSVVRILPHRPARPARRGSCPAHAYRACRRSTG